MKTEFSKLFSTLVLLLVSVKCLAGIDTKENCTTKGLPITPTTSFSVTDDKFEPLVAYWNEINTISVQNSVYVRILDNLLMPNLASFKVELDIISYKSPGVEEPLETRAFYVNYNPASGSAYKGMDVFEFTGAFKIVVRNIRITYAAGGPVPQPMTAAFQVGATVSVNRKYPLQIDADFPVTTSLIPPSNRQLLINWDFLPGEEEVDLEWTTIDAGSKAMAILQTMIDAGTGTVSDPATLDGIFRNNASRITTSAQSYTLSLLYNNDYIALRVRQVQYDVNGLRIEGKWVYKCKKGGANSYSYNFIPLQWNEPLLNWQYAASFAEEGKKKEVVSYFDGSLRNRQTVTLSNSENVAVVQEDIYDEFGRKTASILPGIHRETANGLTPFLHYIPTFNLDAHNLPYRAANIFGNYSFCEPLPQPLSTLTGAAKYYSSNTHFNTGFNRYLPDAEGYPLSVTQYTADNSGRIKTQGGVGAAFQPGLTPRRTTRYFYGKPEQWELDQLFGNDVGYAEHYLKNMVIDPNGQISVSYLNGSGKTIATALAGGSPENTVELPAINKETKKKITHLLKPDQFVFDGSAMKLTARTTYVESAVENDVTLVYDIPQILYYYPDAPNLCSNCFYTLNISIIDDCGNSIALPGFEANTPIGSMTSNDHIPASPPRTISGVNFDHPGEYYITIELSYNKQVVEDYADTYLEHAKDNHLLKKQFEYIKENYLDGIKASGCYNDCKTCELTLGSEVNFIAMLTAKFNEYHIESENEQLSCWGKSLYEELKAHCDDLKGTCNSSPCSAYRVQMEADLSPGGQYALFDQDLQPLEPTINEIYKHFGDKFGPANLPDRALFNSEYVKQEDGTVISVYSSEFDKFKMVKYWNPLWASKFIEYHPEFCKLEFCENNADIFRWDENVSLTQFKASDPEKLPGAAAGLVYDESKYNLLLDLDPFFNGVKGASYKPAMLNDLLHYSKNIVFDSSSSANDYNEKNISQYVSYQLYCNSSTVSAITPAQWNNCSLSSDCRAPDREWRSYVELYLKLKQKYYNQARNCTNGCTVGPPAAVPLPGACPMPGSFSVSKADVQNCDPDKQTVKFTFTGGKLTKAVTLYYYYPGFVGNTQSVTIPAGQSSVNVCISETIALNQIQIVSVDCETYTESLEKCVTLSDSEYSSESYELLFWMGFWQGHDYLPFWKIVRRTTIQLLAKNGLPAIATTPVTVTIRVGHKKLNRDYSPYWSETTTLPDEFYTITIPVGSSSAYFEYVRTNPYKYDGDGNLHDNILTFKNAVSITGAEFCTGFSIENPESPPVSNCSPLYQYKIPRFPDGGSTDPQFLDLIEGDGAKTVSKNEFDHQIREIAEVNAEEWISALTPGVTAVGGTAQLTALRNRLIDVYIKGSDFSRLFGASSSADATAAGDHNFGQVIHALFPSGGTTKFRPDLNPWLITGPYPHDKQPQRVSNIITRTNAAICDQLTRLKNNYIATLGGGSYTLAGFYTYLKTTYSVAAVTISEAELQALLDACACNNVLKQDINLPVFLNGDVKGCISKAELTAAIAEMNDAFSPALSTSDPNYPTIFTNFLNTKWGFTITFEEYQKFYNTGTGNLCAAPDYVKADIDPYACIKGVLDAALASGTKAHRDYLAAARAKFLAAYVDACSLAKTTVDLKVQPLLYHYTLYYYDQADNLLRTVPPQGVALLDDAQIERVQLMRDANDAAGCKISYNGPTVAADAAAASTALRNALASSGNTAVEMWLNNLGSSSDIVVKSPTENYVLKVELNGNTLSVAVFSDPVNAFTYRQINKVSLNLTNLPPIGNWTHLVIQGTNLSHDPLQVYVNGISPPVISGTAMEPGGVNIGALKHLRFYNRILNDREIIANAVNSCFSTLISAAGWYRFNLPDACSQGTAGAGSTVENNLNYIYPDHKLTTTYVYNATNQVTQQVSPDGGTNRFWYDLLSRLNISQNDKQLAANNYSYTTYDALGRITEVGQKNQNSVNIGDPDYLVASRIDDFKAAGTNSEITHTYYDESAPAGNGITALTQSNLRKRVAATTYAENPGGGVLRSTYYDYDISGNVKTLWQHIDGLTTAADANTLKRIDYEYDLVAGKVNFVRYQHNKPDAFYYNYKYDAENRLTEAWSGTRAMIDDHLNSQLFSYNRRRDAAYRYYLHGPLARMELGDELSLVQGVDYAYTLQGWLKGVNSTTVEQSADMGGDGTAVPKDAFGYQLTYYGTGPDVANPVADYKPVSTAVANPFDPRVAGLFSYNHNGLYNGNIAAMTVRVPVLGSGWMTNLYKYDQLNRIRNSATYNATSLAQGALQYGWGYNESFTYDGNGNILSSNRTDANMSTAVFRDNLIYTYNKDGNGRLINNRLKQVQEYAADDNNNANELKNGFINYTYDAIGNIINETHTGTGGKNINYDWTVYGKLKSVSGTNVNISYGYNSSGQRTSQTNTNSGITTYYVRDAQGNPLAVYSKNPQGVVTWKEQQLYGSSRLGMWQPEAVVGTDDALAKWNLAGKKRYELSNHLGNVLATISDRRLQLTTNNSTVSGYNADVINAQDYFAFGGLKPGRSYAANNAAAYRYGFNGKENDNEVKGEGNTIDMVGRLLSTAIGTMLTIDPEKEKYPAISPYAFALNTPINALDPDGHLVIFINGQHTGEGGSSKYWGGFDKRIMDALGDHNSRYVDGALGGFANTQGWYDRGFKETSIWQKLAARSSFLASNQNGIDYVFNFSNVNRKVRQNAGLAQGQIDAPNIISKLSEGESIKIVTHSMGSAYSRGYIKALTKYMKSINDNHKIEIVVDVNAFQGAELDAPPGIKTLNKTGGNDGKSVFGALLYYLKKTKISVPSVAPTNGAQNITSEAEKNKSHEIGNMDAQNIPKLDNSGSSKSPIEQGNNNGQPIKP